MALRSRSIVAVPRFRCADSFLTHKSVGREIEVIVDYTRRRLRFAVDGEGQIDARVTGEMLPDAVRPWVQAIYQDDAVVLSSYKWTPKMTPPKPISPEAYEAYVGGAVDTEPWWDNANDARVRSVTQLGYHGGYGRAARYDMRRQRASSVSPTRMRSSGQCSTTIQGTEGPSSYASSNAALHRLPPPEVPTPHTPTHEQLETPYGMSRARADRQVPRHPGTSSSRASPSPVRHMSPERPTPHVRTRDTACTTSYTDSSGVPRVSAAPPRDGYGMVSFAGQFNAVATSPATPTPRTVVEYAGGLRGKDAINDALDEARRVGAAQLNAAAAEAQAVATLSGSGAEGTARARQQAVAVTTGDMHMPWNVERWLACGDGGVAAMDDAQPWGAAAGPRITAAVAAALNGPLQAVQNQPAPMAQHFVRALAAQPDRQHAVEKMLRDGGVIERIAAEVCAAAGAYAEEHASDGPFFRSGSEQPGNDNWRPEA